MPRDETNAEMVERAVALIRAAGQMVASSRGLYGEVELRLKVLNSVFAAPSIVLYDETRDTEMGNLIRLRRLLAARGGPEIARVLQSIEQDSAERR